MLLFNRFRGTRGRGKSSQKYQTAHQVLLDHPKGIKAEKIMLVFDTTALCSACSVVPLFRGRKNLRGLFGGRIMHLRASAASSFLQMLKRFHSSISTSTSGRHQRGTRRTLQATKAQPGLFFVSVPGNCTGFFQELFGCSSRLVLLKLLTLRLCQLHGAGDRTGQRVVFVRLTRQSSSHPTLSFVHGP